MAPLGLHELELYRGPLGKLQAGAVILGQVRVVGLYMSPRMLVVVATAWIAAQSILFVWRPASLLGVAMVSGASWSVLLGAVLVSAAHRARPALRRDLIRIGIPVCLECGYDLRGSPIGAGRCPECGADVSRLETRASEPLPEAALYPELSRYATANDARGALRAAFERAGVLVRYRRVTLLAGLVAVMILWNFAFIAADAIAAHLRRDLTPAVIGLLLSAAIVSFLLATGAWYALVVARVRRELRRGGPAVAAPSH
ncbi:MAG: hypothetical protein WD749_05690 [Phycisphaerales bacterium]